MLRTAKEALATLVDYAMINVNASSEGAEINDAYLIVREQLWRLEELEK